MVLLRLLLVVGLLGAGLWQAPAKSIDGGRELQVTPEDNLATNWSIRAASLTESYPGTTVLLTLKNVSNSVSDGTLWYGELFDDSGRLCFSAVFSSNSNLIKSGPIYPGETRDVYSQSPGLFSGTMPHNIRVYLLPQKEVDGNIFAQENLVVRTPPISDGSLGTGDTLIKLLTASRLSDQSFQDLALVKVHIDENGRAETVNVLDVAGEDTRSWVIDFVQHKLRFYPSTINGKAVPDDLLVMIHKVPSSGDVRALFTSPDESTWLKNFVNSETAAVGPIPNVLLISLGRPSTTVRSMTGTTIQRGPFPDDLLELKSWSSDWSLPALRFVADPSTPLHVKRTPALPSDQ